METKQIIIAQGVEAWNFFEQSVVLNIEGFQSAVLHAYGSVHTIAGGCAEWSVNNTIITCPGFSAASGFSLDQDVTNLIVPVGSNRFKMSLKDPWGTYAYEHYYNLKVWLDITAEKVGDVIVVQPTPWYWGYVVAVGAVVAIIVAGYVVYKVVQRMPSPKHKRKR